MTPLNTRPNPTFTLEPTYLKRWTVQDYHRMSELGILDPNERTELIAGQITLMAAKGTPHVTSLHLLANALRDQLGSTALIRTQDPIQLDDFSEPEPDLAIVKGTVLDYAHGTEPSFSLGVSQFHSHPHLHFLSSLVTYSYTDCNQLKPTQVLGMRNII